MSDHVIEDRAERAFDVVLWGATGFTGQLTAESLLRTYGVGRELRWAVGGRDVTKLKSLRERLSEKTGLDASALPIELGDATDASFLSRLARKSRVICSTVGPYSRHGTPLVEACVHGGTDYCDLTGELQWIRHMIDRFDSEARTTGARIVHSCGFDCVPSDLGVYFIQREMRKRYGVAAPRVGLGIQKLSGAVSGGTAASILTILEDARRDPAVLQVLRDPYSLNPEGERSGPDSPDRFTSYYDTRFRQWAAPFIMSVINTKVVRRSNALLDWSYGRDFRYDEGLLMGAGLLGAMKAGAFAGGSGVTMAALASDSLRRWVSRWLPQPGEGPSQQKREQCSFSLLLVADDGSDSTLALRGRVCGDQDPGYGSTSKMLGECAVCLARDAIEGPGGIWTPAALMGDPLLERLPRSAGVTFEID